MSLLQFRPCTIETCAPLWEREGLVCGVGCDTSVINLCCWQFLYESSVAEYKGNFLFRFVLDGSYTYSLRFKPADLPELIEVLRQEAKAQGVPLRIMGVNEPMLPYFEQASQGSLKPAYLLDYSDYVYSRESLETLAGKKLQSKRNFLNRFKRNYPGYEYSMLQPSDIEDCLALDKSWINKGLDLGHTDEEKNERLCIKYVFDHWIELRAIGGVLRVDGNLVAFTYGSAIDDQHFDVCVEKANTEYEGAYAVINNEFVRHLPQQYIWINREEDLGIEGLRKAKMSYQPAIRLHKYMLSE